MCVCVCVCVEEERNIAFNSGRLARQRVWSPITHIRLVRSCAGTRGTNGPCCPSSGLPTTATISTPQHKRSEGERLELRNTYHQKSNRPTHQRIETDDDLQGPLLSTQCWHGHTMSRISVKQLVTPTQHNTIRHIDDIPSHRVLQHDFLYTGQSTS